MNGRNVWGCLRLYTAKQSDRKRVVLILKKKNRNQSINLSKLNCIKIISRSVRAGIPFRKCLFTKLWLMSGVTYCLFFFGSKDFNLKIDNCVAENKND